MKIQTSDTSISQNESAEANVKALDDEICDVERLTTRQLDQRTHSTRPSFDSLRTLPIASCATVAIQTAHGFLDRIDL